ncbi:MAG: DNA gyrase inhibitor YacG [Holosporales bacterium]|jgi:endogenous inhibitor of DNA gyrase (YacG/DUF329 family)|nr:DNA gyrase inhibitor YacG [Holosporales bacterium]
MQCPICGKKIQGSVSFCSKECQLIDLNRWFKGTYRIQTDEKPDDKDISFPVSQEENE